MQVIYDGTFEGFLTLVYDVYYKKLKPTNISRTAENSLFMDEVYEVVTDENNANKVLEAIKNSFNKEHLNLILNMFFCDNEEFEMLLLQYIITGFKDKNELNNINNPFVFKLQRMQKELFYTVHKMYGFTRFVELDDGTLYAKIETKHNVVYFLGKHFYKRLNNQKYIIHDINRKIAFIKNDEYLGIQNISSFEEPNISENEEHFAKLWCEFFDAVSIESRENEKCQQNFMPLLFRTYMTEFSISRKT